MGDTRSDERGLGLVHVYAICTGAMFSSGFFLLPGIAAASTGGSVPIAYLIAGLLVLPAVLSTAELSTAFPRAGGPFHFLHRSMGPGVALVGALGLWVAMMLKAAFALVGIGVYLTLLIEVPTEPVAVGLAAAFTALNLAGARESARLQIGLVAVLLVVLLGFLGAGLFDLLGGGDEPSSEAFAPFLDGGAFGLLAASAMVFVAYAGVLQVASVAGEVRDPERTIIRGLLLALATTTAFYVAGTALMVMLLGTEEIVGDQAPVASSAEMLAVPFALVLVVAAALAAFASTGNAGIMSAARYPLALARERFLWSPFARINQRGAPTWAVLTTGVVTAAIIVGFDVEEIASLASALLLVVFALLNLAVVVLRRGRVAGYHPGFRSPWFPWVQWFGVAIAVVLVIDLGLGPVLLSATVMVVGAAWYGLASRTQDHRGGAAIRLLRRLRRGAPDAAVLDDLQDVTPEADDRASDLLESMSVRMVEQGGGFTATRGAAADQLAARVGVAPEEAAGWLSDRRHVSLRVDAAVMELHHLQLDWTDETFVFLAWTPGSARRDESGSGPIRGHTTVVIVGPPDERDRCLRVASLLIRQLCDDEVDDQWPDGRDRAVADDAVREVLARDAAHRHGGDPPPPTGEERDRSRVGPGD